MGDTHGVASQVGFQSNEVCALEALRREHLGAVVVGF